MKSRLSGSLLAQTLLVLAAATAGAGANAQSTVMIGEPSWPGAKIIANLIRTVVTTRLGRHCSRHQPCDLRRDGRWQGRYRRAP
jgi:ABC-type proline/glycine betaine transport system substrate-binding protein